MAVSFKQRKLGSLDLYVQRRRLSRDQRAALHSALEREVKPPGPRRTPTLARVAFLEDQSDSKSEPICVP
jgi:hypothetical protein